jgi:hypothetical protein
MDDKSHSINRTDNISREPDTSGAAANTGNNAQEGSEGNEDVGLTPNQLNNVRRSPSSRGMGSDSITKPFITGTDSDGQL